MRRTAHTSRILLALLLASGHAAAQEAAADALFDSARTALSKGDFDRACEQFRASDKLDPAPGTELNLADCEEKRGHLASAWVQFRSVEEKLPPNDERIAVAHARAEALRARVPKLTLSLAPNAPRTSTVRDGSVELGSAAFGIALPLDPGAHRLLVSAPGFTTQSFDIQLTEGETRSLVVTPGAATGAVSAAVSGPSQPVVSHDAASAGRPGRRTLGFVLGGVGVAGLSVGTVAGLLMASKKSAVDDGCHPDKSCTNAGLAAAHSAHDLQIVANVSWVVGAAALGAGTYFLLTSGPSSKPSSSVALAPSPGGGQLSFSRSW